jgi:hypothetical protein
MNHDERPMTAVQIQSNIGPHLPRSVDTTKVLHRAPGDLNPAEPSTFRCTSIDDHRKLLNSTVAKTVRRPMALSP